MVHLTINCIPLTDSNSLIMEPACTQIKLYGIRPRNTISYVNVRLSRVPNSTEKKNNLNGISMIGEAKFKNQFGVNGTSRKNNK